MDSLGDGRFINYSDDDGLGFAQLIPIEFDFDWIKLDVGISACVLEGF